MEIDPHPETFFKKEKHLEITLIGNVIEWVKQELSMNYFIWVDFGWILTKMVCKMGCTHNAINTLIMVDIMEVFSSCGYRLTYAYTLRHEKWYQSLKIICIFAT